MEANALGGGPHTIVLQAGQPYTLSLGGAPGDEDAGREDDLDITGNIVIEGNGSIIQLDPMRTLCALGDAVDPSEFALFEVLSTGDLTLRNIWVRNGCGDADRSIGPGINNFGRLTVIESIISGNFGVFGAGIYNAGTATIVRSTIGRSNIARKGGGIYNRGTITITDSVIYVNASDGAGGGIYNSGTLNIINTTVSRNKDLDEGEGGGIYNDTGGVVNASFVTIAKNSKSATTTGAGGVSNAGTFNIRNSIVGDNTANGGSNCSNSGTLNASGVNFATDGSCSGFTQVTSAQLNLQPLDYNGGPTLNHALGPGSVAIDAVTVCTDINGMVVTKDQRGFRRPKGAGCDAGAVEMTPPATFTVNTTADTPDANPGDGVCVDASDKCSLRGAVMEANALGDGPHTIILQAGQPYMLSRDVTTNDTPAEDDVDVRAAVTIRGNGATVERDPGLPCNLTTPALGLFRIFDLDSPGAALTLVDVTVRNGCAAGAWGGAISNGFPQGTLTLVRSTVSGNSANRAGAIFNGGTLTLIQSTLSANTSTDNGGAIDNYGTVNLINTTISGNNSGRGSEDVGGIWNRGTLNASFVTIANNTGSTTGAGGIFNAGGTANMKNAIVGDNTAGGVPNCAGAGTLNASGVNFATDGSCSGFTQVTSAQLNLGPLANNGGPTPTHALGRGSVAIDVASDCTDLGNNPVTTDQRGVARPQGPKCDAGAFEREAGGYRLYLPLVVR
jgi:CSLREA domain-containing protein